MAFSTETISGNATVLSIELDGEAIYTSEPLQPGEVVETFELEKELPAGSYEALAVTTIMGEDGEPQLVSRVPVTIAVK